MLQENIRINHQLSLLQISTVIKELSLTTKEIICILSSHTLVKKQGQGGASTKLRM